VTQQARSPARPLARTSKATTCRGRRPDVQQIAGGAARRGNGHPDADRAAEKNTPRRMTEAEF